MAQNPKAMIAGKHFTWRQFKRNGVFYADGRGNAQPVGKHSLGTRDPDEALERIYLLDQKMAIRFGIIDANQSDVAALVSDVSISESWQLYMEHCARPEILGGATAGTQKRYRAIRDKHIRYCKGQRLTAWSMINKSTTEKYGTWLAGDDYADRTIMLELNTVCSVSKWLSEKGHIGSACRFQLNLGKIDSTDTYCYRREEVAAMVQLCQKTDGLHWMADVITGLATTGLRIGEFSELRWSDIDLQANTIQLTDERHSSRRKRLGNRRTTKGKRGRALPLHSTFKRVLESMEHLRDGRVLHGPRGGKLKPDTIRNVLIREVIEPLTATFPTADGEIGFESGRLHSFRHYFVSESFRQGATEAQIMSWVGHKDSKMVAHYRHLRSDDSQRTMSQIDFLETGGTDGPDQPKARPSRRI